MPHPIECLLDVEEDHRGEAPSIETVDDMFSDPEKYVYWRVFGYKTVLYVGGDIVGVYVPIHANEQLTFDDFANRR